MADPRRDQPTVTAAEGRAPAVLPPGTPLGGRYRIEELLGSGGMGHVYRAADLELAREVALKTMRVVSESALVRLRREVRLASRVTHENVIRLYDLVHAGGVCFVTMELVHGVSLRTRIAAGPLPLAEATGIARQCALGLAAAHHAGVVHRDFKPENVLLGADGRVVVVDFGVAGEQVDGAVAASAIVGTSVYMAPEQAGGMAPTPAADLYALGLVLAEMLTGELPLAGRGAVNTALRRQMEAPPSLRERRPEVPAAIDELAQRLLARAPEARPAPAETVAAVLGGAALPARTWPAEVATIDLATAVQHPTARRAATRRRRLTWALAGLLAVLGLTAAWWLWPWRRPSRAAAGQDEVARCLGGDGRTCHELGLRAEGRGAGSDLADAVRFFEHACVKGVPGDCPRAALAYQAGQGATRDPRQAMALLEVGCTGHVDEACHVLGRANRDGWAGRSAPQRAAELFRSACARSYAPACLDYGRLFKGSDDAAAAKLYRRACDLGLREACQEL